MNKGHAPPHRRHFAYRLRDKRIQSGFSTARDFARSLGVSESRYTKWERAETEPDITHLALICQALRCAYEDLLPMIGSDQ